MAAARAPALLLLLALVAGPGLALPLDAPGALTGPSERVLVSLDGPFEPQLRAALPRLGGRVLEEFAFAHVALAEVPASSVAALRALPGVAGVHPEERMKVLLASSRPAVRVGLPIWSSGIEGAGVAVAVVDSGIDGEHPALVGRVLRGVRVDEGGVREGTGDRDGHGTHIAGIVAGDGEGSPGRSHAGMAPRANLVAVDISGSFTTTNAVRAFAWLHDHARELNLRVVSNSWGREKEGAAYDPDDPVIRASDALVRDGVVVVFSAGNLGAGPGTLTVEAQNPNVLTVGATDDEGRVESYSSRGPAKLRSGGEASWTKPDVVAPGTAITSTGAGARRGGPAYVTLNGTSMAAPHAAGIAALLVSANPELTPAQVKEAMMRAARDVGAAGVDFDSGAGLLDAQAAVETLGLAGPAEPQREPFHRSGQARPAAGLLPVSTPLGQGEVRQPLVVPPDAVGVEFVFRWDDPQSSFAVSLEKGDRALGPFSRAVPRGGWMEIRGRVDQGLEPGTWQLVARPKGAALTSNYELEGSVLLRMERHTASELPPVVPGALAALLATDSPEDWAPLLAGIAAALGGAAFAARLVRASPARPAPPAFAPPLPPRGPAPAARVAGAARPAAGGTDFVVLSRPRPPRAAPPRSAAPAPRPARPPRNVRGPL